jgi:hypothetical protein
MEGTAVDGQGNALENSLKFSDDLETQDEIAEVSDDSRFLRYHDVLGKGVRCIPY